MHQELMAQDRFLMNIKYFSAPYGQKNMTLYKILVELKEKKLKIVKVSCSDVNRSTLSSCHHIEKT